MKHIYTRLFFIGLMLIGFSNLGFAQNEHYCGFDGSDDYIKYNDDAILGRMDAATDYTIEAWVYPISATVAEYDRVLQRYYSFQICMYDGNDDGNVEDWYFGVYDKSSDKWKYYNTEGDATLDLDEWNHIAVINSSSDGSLKLYVNGIDVTKSGGYSNRAMPSSHSSDNLYIGQKGNEASYLGGYVDEVRLKNIAEAPANLHFNKYDNQYISDGNTAALFHFNEGTGTTTVNEASSSNANLNNGTNWIDWDAHSHLPLAYEWAGGTDTDWNTSSNWESSSIPTSSNDVIVPNVTNNPTIAGGDTVDCRNLRIDASASLTVSGILNVGGDFINDGSFSTTGTIKYNGADEQIIAAGTYNDLDVDNSSAANCTLAGDVTVNGTLNIAGDITIPNGNTLDCNGDITTTGDCVIHNNGTMVVGGSFTQNGAYTETAGLIKFDGSAAQTIPSDNYYDIEIDNSNGVSLGGNVSVNDVLTLTDGIITSTSANLLTINDGGSVTGGSNTAYVDGPVAKVGSGDFVFPTGDNGKWARIGISGLSGSDTFTAEYTKGAPADNANYNDPLTKVSDNEWWQLDRAGSESADVTLYWEDSKASGIGNASDLRIAHYNGTEWEELSGTITTSGNASLTTSEQGSIKVEGVSSFSPFSYGSTDNTTNTLPVELLDFTLVNVEQGVLLNWSTASEINNYGFEIQRSNDVENWQTIGFVKGAGNSNQIQNYSFTDKSPQVFNYYRLKQIDFDGAFVFSEIKFLKLGEIFSINTYPNPVVNILNMDIDYVKQIDIYDIAGKLIKQYQNLSNSIDVSNFKKGVYFFIVTKNDGTQAKGKFLKN